MQKKGRQVHLTPKQFELLHYLMANAGRPVPHAKLLRSVWGPEYGNELEYLRTFIRQIRMKIEDDPGRSQVSVDGIAYRLPIQRNCVKDESLFWCLEPLAKLRSGCRLCKGTSFSRALTHFGVSIEFCKRFR